MKVLNDKELDLAYEEAYKKHDGSGAQWDSTLTGREIAKAQYRKDIKDFIGLLDREYEDWTASYDHIGKLLKTLEQLVGE